MAKSLFTYPALIPILIKTAKNYILEGGCMSKNIYIIRHCKAEGQSTDAPLTLEGIQQAEQLADFLGNFKIEQIISSPFLRAIQSIKPFAKREKLKIEIDDRLSERVLSSKSLADWMDKLEATYHDKKLTYEGGESSEEATNRIKQVVDDIIKSNINNTMIVTHGNIMSLLLNSYDKNFGFAQWKNLSNPDVFLLQMSPSNVSMKHIWKE